MAASAALLLRESPRSAAGPRAAAGRAGRGVGSSGCRSPDLVETGRAHAVQARGVSAWRGMKKAVTLINAIDIGRFPRLLTRILQKLHLKAESSFSEEEEEKLQAAFSLEKQDLHLVLETIAFILEQAVYHNVKPAALQQQLQSIHLSRDKAEAFASAWAAVGQETVEKFRQRILAPHKLETVGWQLNLQMAHSAQAKLKSPQAVLQLGVSTEDSKSLEKVLVEFSHEELFEFYNKLETIQAQLDSLM
ncbi:COMM domain-containing protein 10 isoform X1 [Oryctolagus cuniculus]|uniref:COMM domain-containing protein 10 isoform X1 n=2 Tax=Oryctolagus cuniculus TaxID=9986 RepID=UPI003879328A